MIYKRPNGVERTGVPRAATRHLLPRDRYPAQAACSAEVTSTCPPPLNTELWEELTRQSRWEEQGAVSEVRGVVAALTCQFRPCTDRPDLQQPWVGPHRSPPTWITFQRSILENAGEVFEETQKTNMLTVLKIK